MAKKMVIKKAYFKKEMLELYLNQFVLLFALKFKLRPIARVQGL